MPGAIDDLARTQVADQQLVTTEYIQEQEIINIVVAMEESPFLITMHPIISAIKIENQFFQRPLMRCDELLNKHLKDNDSYRQVSPVFQTTQGQRTAQACIPIHGSLKDRIPSRIIMIIQVFISLAQAVYPLPQQRQLITLHVTLITEGGR